MSDDEMISHLMKGIAKYAISNAITLNIWSKKELDDENLEGYQMFYL